jgi:hypothetical protein
VKRNNLNIFIFISVKTRRRGASSSIDDIEKESSAGKQEVPERAEDSPVPSAAKRLKTEPEVPKQPPLKHGTMKLFTL